MKEKIHELNVFKGKTLLFLLSNLVSIFFHSGKGYSSRCSESVEAERSRIRTLEEVIDFLFSTHFQTGPGAHSVSCTWVHELFPEGKADGA